MTITKPALFRPIKAGSLTLKHRVVLAPLTRMRADVSTAVPNDLSAEYYAQRSTDGGLLISEATFIAAEAGGISGVPGIYSPQQIAKWKETTDAVHKKGGLIFLQLWALGRVANPKLVPTVWAVSGNKPFSRSDNIPTPVTQLAAADIDRFVGHYRQAALNAIEAGFDGVEIHGANGYLVDQFLQPVSNDRTDEYGGSLENRLRFPLRVLNAVSQAIGPERVGIRASPFGEFQGMRGDFDPLTTFTQWFKAIVAAQPKLAYVHAVAPRVSGVSDVDQSLVDKRGDSLDSLRAIVQAAGIAFISAGGATPADALAEAEKVGDLIAFGRYFISNPDLPARIENGWELTPYNRKTFYTPGAEGYTDYPVHNARL
ncbi:Flavin oxidoreductase hxnT [Vanrija pseudolonga]|uniref:Flavin oxidoreductase hxnT n=1 Tax=Vanrija pseudolonga TaxID=143232 RepID=A0AAF0YE38_9TREE|nr:Flavin oxidoreductase hxnT [Vanrija pseudolonga]WOO83152.1 Flavin oxidoreductase hxnT [Vanrija pseudolonga]